MPAGWKHTDETRAKIKESQQARGAKARSDAAKQAKKTMGAEARSAAAKKGHETRRAKATAGSGVPGTFAEGSFMSAGWKHTDETRAKIKESQQARGAKARSDAAKQAKKTMGAEARSAAAKKGHETRQAKATAGSGVPGTFAEGSFMSAPGVGEASLGSQSFAAVASVSPSVFRLPSISQVPALREGLQAVIPEHLKAHRSADSSQARGPRR